MSSKAESCFGYAKAGLNPSCGWEQRIKLLQKGMNRLLEVRSWCSDKYVFIHMQVSPKRKLQENSSNIALNTVVEMNARALRTHSTFF